MLMRMKEMRMKEMQHAQDLPSRAIVSSHWYGIQALQAARLGPRFHDGPDHVLSACVKFIKDFE